MEVSPQPGDNYRVAVSLFDTGKTEVGKITDHNVPASDDQMPGRRATLSRLLTIWRKVHLELDRMEVAKTPQAYFPGWRVVVPVKITPRGNGKDLYDILLTNPWNCPKPVAGITKPNVWYDYGHDAYENGSLSLFSSSAPNVFKGTSSLPVKYSTPCKDTDRTWTVTVEGKKIPTSWVSAGGEHLKGPWRPLILQDDDERPAVLLQDTDMFTARTKREFSKAYVDIALSPANTRRPIPFDALVQADTEFKKVLGKVKPHNADLPFSPAYWSSRMIVAFEPPPYYNALDPDRATDSLDRALGFMQPVWDYDTAVRAPCGFVFVECIRDQNSRLPSGWDPLANERTLIHEIAHQGSAKHKDGGVMARDVRLRVHRVITEKSQRRIRRTIKWGTVVEDD